MYVNAALRDPFREQDPSEYASGGPTWNVLDIWKAAAPSIDIIAPDIYLHDYRGYTRTLDLYGTANNALFVPETGNRPGERALFLRGAWARGPGVLAIRHGLHRLCQLPVGCGAGSMKRRSRRSRSTTSWWSP